MTAAAVQTEQPPRVPALPALGEDALRYLRWLRPERCVVFASWAALEPREGHLDAVAADALREQLITVGSLGAQPVLCLFRDEAPGWFSDRGGWKKEDNLRCYLRYVGRVVRAVGHLAGDYITFYTPNSLAWRGDNRRYSLRALSNMACVHVRACRLIRDTRASRQLEDTRVGFVVHLEEGRELRRELSRRDIAASARTYIRLPVEAMAKGEFRRPMKNVLRVQPGTWTDFVGITGPKEEEKRRSACALVRELSGAEAWIMEE